MQAEHDSGAGEVLLVSSVRVEVLASLADALVRHGGLAARVRSGFDATAWRATRSSGRVTDIVIRLLALLFPLTVRVGGRRRRRVVVATTNPFWLPTLLALRGARPLVALVYDVYPDALQVRWRLPGWLVAALRWVVGIGLRRADHVVALGDRVAAALDDRHRLGGRITIIPTGADPHDFAGTSSADVPIDLPDGAVLVSYVGNSGSVHEGRTVGLALAELLRRRPDVRAVVATRGDRAEELQGPLRGSPRVALSGGLEEAPFRATLARTDIALVTLDSGAGLASVPSKFYSALAAGCAVLAVAPDGSDLADLVTTTGAGIVVDPGDVAGALDALERLVDDAGMRARLATAAWAAAASSTPAALAARWTALLGPLLGPARGPDRAHG